MSGKQLKSGDSDEILRLNGDKVNLDAPFVLFDYFCFRFVLQICLEVRPPSKLSTASSKCSMLTKFYSRPVSAVPLLALNKVLAIWKNNNGTATFRYRMTSIPISKVNDPFQLNIYPTVTLTGSIPGFLQESKASKVWKVCKVNSTTLKSNQIYFIFWAVTVTPTRVCFQKIFFYSDEVALQKGDQTNRTPRPVHFVKLNCTLTLEITR
jgi:hypothetical protein